MLEYPSSVIRQAQTATQTATLQGCRRACHTAALSFPPFSCKSSARSISSLFPLAPAHFIRAIPRTTAHFTDHHRTRPVSRNNPKLPFFQLCSRSLVQHAPSLAVCLSRSVSSQSSRHLAHHSPPTRTPHHHLDLDDIAAATASSCSLQLPSQPLKLQSPHDP